MACCKCHSKRNMYDWVFVSIITIVALILEFTGIKSHEQCVPGVNKPCSANLSTNITSLTADARIQYPNKVQTVRDGVLVAIALLPWLTVFCASCICVRTYSAFNHGKCFYFTLQLKAMLFVFMLNLGITDAIKLGVGQPRPYLASVLGTDEENSARKSFPSGHASVGVATNLFLTLCMLYAWKFVDNNYERIGHNFNIVDDNIRQQKSANERSHLTHALDPNQNQSMQNMPLKHGYVFFGARIWYFMYHCRVLSVIVCILPVLLGVWCGCTRLSDYKHFPADIVGGFLIATFCALLGFYVFKDELLIKHFDRVADEVTDKKTDAVNGSPASMDQSQGNLASHPTDINAEDISIKVA